MINNFLYACISDLHLGHRHTSTEHIINNVKQWLLDVYVEYPINALFIAGDLFDGLLDYPSIDAFNTTLFANWLLDWCYSHEIILRVLEGTPSHDWKQSKIFNTLLHIKKYNFDSGRIYIDDLSIEYISKYNKWILYVPDEWRSDTETTLKEVKTLLTNNNLEKIDIAIMHGQFGYQIPNLLNNKILHNEYAYLSIVKNFINIGHVHTYSVYKNIIASGSFDRLAHGEENPKGGVICYIGEDISWHKFIPNNNTKIYITIDVSGLDLNKSNQLISDSLCNMPDGIHIRIKSEVGNPLLINFSDLKKKFISAHITKLVRSDTINNIVLEKPNLSNDVIISPSNIFELCLDGLNNKYGDNPELVSIANNMLKEIINANSN
jgi:hypothetical protein